jgi:hypothetical protein
LLPDLFIDVTLPAAPVYYYVCKYIRAVTRFDGHFYLLLWLFNYLSVLLLRYFRETFRNCWFLAVYKYRKTENKGKESHTFSLLLLQKGEICTCNDNHHETKIEMEKNKC